MKKVKRQSQSSTPALSHLDPEELHNNHLLYRHPNQLLPILHQLASSPSSLPPAQRLRTAALIGFCHPVMNKEVQGVIAKMMAGHLFWRVDANLTLLLEILNIICLVPGINYKSLNIRSLPAFQKGSYQEALWVNALPSLLHGQHFLEVRELVYNVSKENTLRAREFLNNILSLKEKVFNAVYSSSVVALERMESHYHEIDIQLSVQGIITTEYFPEDYKAEYLELWLDRTVELNTLLGNFVCKEKFGEFKYIRGPLLYAMEKGILLVLNNFNQVSNELLVSLKSLSNEGKITLNQKTVRANAGFKILGIVSGDKSNKSKVNIGKLVNHFVLPSKNFEDIVPVFSSDQYNNRPFLLNLLRENLTQLGYEGLKKLWKRIQRLRKTIIQLQENCSEEETNTRLWGSFFTQQFIDSIDLQISDLTSKPMNDRIISYQEKYRMISIGRTEISYSSQPLMRIVKTQYSLKVLEKLNVCFELGEYPLLISQTGCGKTTLVQYLAQLSGHKLFVYNMSSGTDVTDLIGGFKPIDCRVLLKELFYSFLEKFRAQVPGAEKNEAYLNSLNNYFVQGKIELLLKSLIQSTPKIIQQLGPTSNIHQWNEMLKKFNNILSNLDKIDSNLVFSFLQGNLIKALKNGDWILIDEINLATNDVLQKIVPLIQGKSLMLYEKGDLNYIERHKDFRIVACMNPANDSGKKPLPPNLAEKFTTIIMSDPSKPDVQMMVKEICPQLDEYQISQIFFNIKKIKTISLRNLSRALNYINKNKDVYGWSRSVYDGLMLGFGEKEILKSFVNETVPKVIPGTVEISGFLMIKGPFQEKTAEIFHLTETFKEHLKDFLRAIAGTDLPVLLEGPTSAGKTSMIRYVAEAVGYRCIRINNHEHTEIEEYIGNYFPDKTGKLVFREGPLVQAVREGYWLILDELNLAKTQILQCLNRLLDDNRELFIPEQQKHIKPHPNFRIFATQNPASYSGRKSLSRAFRNRFVGISFTDITTIDMMAILQARSPLLKDSKELSSFVKKSLQSLVNYRQRQRVFEKDGLITIRNLLKWCERKFINKQKFAMEGYAILAEKLRNEEQKKFVEKVLLANIKYNVGHIREEYFQVVQEEFSEEKIAETDIYVQMNDSFKRMSALTIKALANNQPVLLVGETGCGKTTLAELLAALTHRKFFSINCHKHMQASDLLGSLRPSINPNSNSKFQFVNGVVVDAMIQGGILLIDEINTAEDSVLERLNQVLECGIIGIERGQGWETVKAKEGFCIIATMNPSGDYGKKELSPALRNRFTQIWVQPITHPQYIKGARTDILKMINHKLTFPQDVKQPLSSLIYSFLIQYNCNIAPRFNLTRKLLTMRDIGWICKFINDSNFHTWQERYFWSIIILAIEGIKYIMTDNVQGSKLEDMKEELLRYLQGQVEVKREWIQRTRPECIIPLIKDMSFPLLIKINTPIEVVGIEADQKIFFSPQTDLSDLLGQYRPHGNDFVWHDEALLRCVKNGGVIGLVDLNMAQQQVIEGINSLFDHRGSLFVVELNQTFHKAATFKPIVILRNQTGHGRKGLPNSFLNRFVKLSIPHVTLDVKLSYLFKRYPNLHHNAQLVSLIRKLIQEESDVTIENIEFVIQFSENGLLNQALEILKLEKYRVDNHPSKFSQYQEQILQLLPLKKSLNITTPNLVKSLLSAYLIYKYSKYNLCVVGPSKSRSNFTQALNYLFRTNYIKILISTMIDINDLLGTYEQISANQEMEVEGDMYAEVFKVETGRDFQSEETKFVFVESQIVKSMRDGENLVYIEVPNEAIAERIQKGLKDVYDLNRKIILGIDTLNPRKSTITKFITIDLTENTAAAFGQDTYALFPENETHLTKSDLQIRQEETKQFIVDSMNQESQRKAMTAWRRLYSSICLKSNQQQQKFQEEIEEKIHRDFLHRYKVSYIPNDLNQARMRLTLGQVWTSSNKQTLLSKVMVQSFFTSDPIVLSKKLSYFNEREEYISKIIKKFQVLYSCNVNNFRQTAKTIMPILFRGTYDSPMIEKYFNEIQRLYQELFKHKIKETLIQFNEEEYKLIPILCNIQSVKYQLHNENPNVRRLCDQGTHLHHIFENLEKAVGESINLIEIDINSVGKWCKQLKIKHLGALELFQSNLQKRNTLFSDLLANQYVKAYLKQIGFEPTNEPVQQYALRLFDAFKPTPNMSQNVSYHLKNQMKVKYITELIADDEQYVKKYGNFCKVKYFQYNPTQLKTLADKLKVHSLELVQVQKLLLYRGYSNIQSLIQFYQQLLHYTHQIQQSNFSKQTIKKAIIETYHSFYHIYNDILLPYYIPLILIYQQQKHHSQSIASAIIGQNRESIVALIESLIMKEEGEVDRSKDYVKFQKKFNRTVIVDQYTEEGVEKNKQILEEEFAELFGKNQNDKQKMESPFEKIHMLINKTQQTYYPYLSKIIISHPEDYQELVIGLQLLLKYQQKNLNIYEEYNPYTIKMLVQPLPGIMQEIHELINKYPIDNIKNLSNICNKIQERSLYDEIYKILIDCEFLVEKIFEVNAILLMANHIKIDKLIENCLKVRRLELNNWKEMMELKVRRTEKSDMIEFIELYKNVREIKNEKELFALCEKYLRESKLTCLDNRIKLLFFLQKKGVIPDEPSYAHALHRVIGFFEYLQPDIKKEKQKARKEKELEMKEYEKLAGWSSNEYLIFKATCEKFQRKIHHILRRCDDELSMSVGTFHQQLLAKQLFNSMKDFSLGLRQLTQTTVVEEEEEEQQEENNDENEEGKEKTEKVEKKKEEEIEEMDIEENDCDEYQKLNLKIFRSLKELQQQQHNNQSKLFIIRAYLLELEQIFQEYTTSSKQEYKYLTRDMFSNDQDHQRAVKYYYGLWDKLCQRSQTNWNQEIIDRLWRVTEKIWVHINKILKYTVDTDRDELGEDLKILFGHFLNHQGKYHNVFVTEIAKVKEYIAEHDVPALEVNNSESLIQTETISLMKLGYILSNIAVNLQKNGLCAKQEEEQAQGSEKDQVGEGMGIGEGEVADGAENVGEEIEFQEQVLGNKDQKKNENDNASNKEDEDIEMQADFDGEMHSNESQKQGESKQDGKEQPDEKMGDVDDEERQADMKNEEGQAEGEEQADVDIKNQKEGEEELVDNERQKKEERKGEDKREMSEEGQEEEQEKSDWDQNNQEGEKINKQKQNVEAPQEDESSYGLEKEREPEEVQSDQNDMQEYGKENEQEQEGSGSQKSNEQQEGDSNKDQEVEGQVMQEEQNEDNENQNGEQNQEQNKKQKRGHQTKQYNPAYGRRDMNTNNQVLNDEEQPAQQANNDGQKEQGQGDGKQNSGNPIHNLSADFLEEILKQQRSEGNEKFVKDLNVLMQDQNEPQPNKEEQGAEQYELTEEKDKFATNLPLVDDQKMVDQKEEQEERQKDKKKQEREEGEQKKAKKEQEKQEGKDKQKKKSKEEDKASKNQNNNANQNIANNQEKDRIKRQEKQVTKTNDKADKEMVDEDELKEKLIRQAVDSMKPQKQEKPIDPRTNDKKLLSESFEVSKILEEQLKSVLQPMDNAEYRGDFKTGKKLNLKKIIPFIASNYRKDRIWLRRTEPSERNYYVMIALDDTKSMHYGQVGEQALKGTLAISMALEHLSIKTSICSIRDQMAMLKNFGDLLNSQNIMNNFQFTYESSNSHDLSMAAFMNKSLEVFRKVEEDDINIEVKKICFIISDGKMNKKLVHPFMKDVKKQDVTYIFIIVDSQQSSILNIKTVEYTEDKKMKIKNYMSDFPFEYFLIINDVKELGEILAMTLMQFIQEK